MNHQNFFGPLNLCPHQINDGLKIWWRKFNKTSTYINSVTLPSLSPNIMFSHCRSSPRLISIVDKKGFVHDHFWFSMLILGIISFCRFFLSHWSIDINHRSIKDACSLTLCNLRWIDHWKDQFSPTKILTDDFDLLHLYQNSKWKHTHDYQPKKSFIHMCIKSYI